MAPPETNASKLAGRPAASLQRERVMQMVDVRHEDLLIKRVTVAGAEELVSRGWAEWIGRGCRRYVRMTPAAPLSALHGFRPSVHTQPVVADDSCRDHAAGQVIGHPRTNREFC